jgi:hypothetical protein
LAELINLNKARKRRDRKQRAVDAAAQRVKHGRSKQQKQLDAEITAAAQRKLDGLRRTSEEGGDA